MPTIFQTSDSTMHLLQKVLDLRSQNQQLIASNIANAETPGYSPAQLEFEQELGKVLHGGLRAVASHPDHLPVSPNDFSRVTGTITRTPDQTGIGDENGVSVDQEMIRLSENQILYEAATTMIKKKLGLIMYAANDGK